MPQKLLRAGAALAVLAVAAAIAGVSTAHPAAADAARGGSRPGAGDVAVARRRLNVVAGRRAMLAGRVVGAAAGRFMALERRSGARWHTIDRARTAAGGRFAFRFRPQRPASAAVRVRAGAARERVGRLNVYRRAQVSWYGPGLYGGHLGCGGTPAPGAPGGAPQTPPGGGEGTPRPGGGAPRGARARPRAP